MKNLKFKINTERNESLLRKQKKGCDGLEGK